MRYIVRRGRKNYWRIYSNRHVLPRDSIQDSHGLTTGAGFYDKIRTGVKMGALNRMLNAKPGLVYTRFINLTEKEKECFMMLRAYISGFDFS